MKKIYSVKLAILILFIMLFLLSGCNMSDDAEKSLEQKIKAENSYIDGELISMANDLNDINYAKYKVEVYEVDNASESTGDSESKNGSNEQKNEGKSGEDSGTDSKNQNSESSDKTFSMKSNNILGKKADIDWDDLKNRIETLYTAWTTISIDLKEKGISNEKINDFGYNMDITAVAIKNEDKVAALDSIIKLYGFLPEFAEMYDDSSSKNVLKSKYNLLVCYKYADQEKWEELQTSIGDLKMSFSNVRNKADEYEGKKANIENSLTIINEMQNSVNIMDKDTFLIKYKNLIQELNIILSM